MSNPTPEKSLPEQLNDLADDLTALKNFRRNVRRTLIIGVVGLTLDLLLSVGLGILSFQTAEVADRADKATNVAARTAENQHNRCELFNEFKEANKAQWHRALTSLPPTDGTPQAQANRERFVSDLLAFINESNKPEDCARYRVP